MGLVLQRSPLRTCTGFVVGTAVAMAVCEPICVDRAHACTGGRACRVDSTVRLALCSYTSSWSALGPYTLSKVNR